MKSREQLQKEIRYLRATLFNCETTLSIVLQDAPLPERVKGYVEIAKGQARYVLQQTQREEEEGE